jgi:hypothetical protein
MFTASGLEERLRASCPAVKVRLNSQESVRIRQLSVKDFIKR